MIAFDSPDWATLGEAAAAVGVSRQYLTILVSRGQIISVTTKLGRLYSVADCQRVAAQRRERTEAQNAG